MRITRRMKRLVWIVAGWLALISGLALPPAAFADFEPTGPAVDKANNLVLVLERKTEGERRCRFAVRLTNNAPYEVQSLVLYYSAYRVEGVIYATVTAGSAFTSLKPGDSQAR